MRSIGLGIEFTRHDIFEQFTASYAVRESKWESGNEEIKSSSTLCSLSKHSQIEYQIVIILFLYAVVQTNDVRVLKFATHARFTLQLLEVTGC